MISLEKGKFAVYYSCLIPFGKASGYLGTKILIGTIHHWRMRDLRIDHDKAVRFDGRFYVKKHKIERFLERLNANCVTKEEKAEVNEIFE